MKSKLDRQYVLPEHKSRSKYEHRRTQETASFVHLHQSYLPLDDRTISRARQALEGQPDAEYLAWVLGI